MINSELKAALKVIPVGQILYTTTSCAAEGAGYLASFVGQLGSTTVSYIDPSLEASANSLNEQIGELAQQVNEAATTALTDGAVSEFVASEMIGPVVLSLACGWFGMKYAHSAFKASKLLLTCRRFQEEDYEQQTGRKGSTLVGKFVKEYDLGAQFFKAATCSLVAPLLLVAGIETQKAIAERLVEVGASFTPLNYLVLSAAAAYIISCNTYLFKLEE